MDETSPTLETQEKADRAQRGRYDLSGADLDHRVERVKLKR